MKITKLEQPHSITSRLASRVVSLSGTRLLDPEGALSIDGLDAAIRGFGVATVVLLSVLGYGHGAGGGSRASDVVDPMVVSFGLLLYNLLVITALGVPLRRTPTFPLFVLDWTVATVAVLATGGFLSPFIILYYALGIGAALRVGLSRSMMLVAGCAVVYVILSFTGQAQIGVAKLPILVVEITSLAMVVLTGVGMKNALEVEARRVQLEEQTAAQFRLLNSLINTVLSASLDLEQVMRTVAAVSSEALHAQSGMAVLFKEQATEAHERTGATGATGATGVYPFGDVLLVADQGPNPPQLSEAEKELLAGAVASRMPLVLDLDTSEPGTGRRMRSFPGLERSDNSLCSVACVPFSLQGEVIGALFLGRYHTIRFTEAETSLLTAIGSQMAVAVRLARLYEMERDKATRSEEREQLERDLLSMVSHELRTPLTSIKTCVGALSDMSPQPGREEEQSSTQAKLVHNIGRSTDRLISLVNELLDMARLRAGRVSLQMQQVHLGGVVADVAGQIAPLVEDRNQTLQLDLPLEGSARWHMLAVNADRRRIEQVLINLVANANKYSPPRSKITVGATPRDGQVRVFVRDEGPGVAGHEQGRIFEKFYTVESTTESTAHLATSHQSSMGLGLAIARSIVELHGGVIGVSSRPGSGSTFYFTLPQLKLEADMALVGVAQDGGME